MGAANLLGGYLGARTAIARGNGFVRRVFLVVVAALALKLAYDTVRDVRLSRTRRAARARGPGLPGPVRR